MALTRRSETTRRDDAIIRRALAILEGRLRTNGPWLSHPQATADYLRLRLAEAEREVFAVLWLDSQNVLIEYQELFRGTLAQTVVFPREVVKDALRCNAAGAIIAHNHPSGLTEPSQPDLALTQELIRVLALVGVKVLDHFVVGGTREPFSFSANGLMQQLQAPATTIPYTAPARTTPKKVPVDIVNGVSKRTDAVSFDQYEGTAEALVAAGVVAPGKFPGMAGMPKTVLFLNPAGIPWPGKPNVRKTGEYEAEGARRIHRKTPGTFVVCVRVSDAEAKARKASMVWS